MNLLVFTLDLRLRIHAKRANSFCQFTANNSLNNNYLLFVVFLFKTSTGDFALWVFPKYTVSLTASPMDISQATMVTMDSSSPVYQMGMVTAMVIVTAMEGTEEETGTLVAMVETMVAMEAQLTNT